MAIGVMVEIPGGTQKQYDHVMRKLNLGGRLPAGALSHVAGPMEGGWRVIDIWEDKEDFLLFVQDCLMKAMQEAGMPPAQTKFFPVHNVLLPGQQAVRRAA